MTDPFALAVALILDREGLMTNNTVTDLHGGLTRYGWSQIQNPDMNIATLTRDQAVAAYKTKKWIGGVPGFPAVRCDKMPWPLSLMVFDCAVNQGNGTAIKILQSTLNLPQDGIVGPATLVAITARDCLDLTARFCAKRVVAYTKLDGWKANGEGWAYRVALNCLDSAQLPTP